jgi:hypothetical protein
MVVETLFKEKSRKSKGIFGTKVVSNACDAKRL